jgi:hypothetical protein
MQCVFQLEKQIFYEKKAQQNVHCAYYLFINH